MSLSDALLLEPYPFEIFIAYRMDGVKGSGTRMVLIDCHRTDPTLEKLRLSGLVRNRGFTSP